MHLTGKFAILFLTLKETGGLLHSLRTFCSPNNRLVQHLAHRPTTLWRSYQANVNEIVKDIGDRLDSSINPEARFDGMQEAQAHGAFEPLEFSSLRRAANGDISDDTVKTFCAKLERWHFAIIRLDDPKFVTAIRDLWNETEAFYSMGDDNGDGKIIREKRAGPVRSTVNDATRTVGYAALDENEFLDTRIGTGGTLHPPLFADPPNSAAQLRFLNGWRTLAEVGRTACEVAALRVGGAATKENWLRLLDCGEDVPEGSLSTSVHRFCHYRNSAARDSELETNADSREKKPVAFGAHTDATFFTVIPVAAIPGLQVYTSDTGFGWVSPELCGVHGTDVVLLPGEFTQVLSNGRFPCAVHRVLKPQAREGSSRVGGDGLGRLSAPLLLRGCESEPLADREHGDAKATETSTETGNPRPVSTPRQYPPGVTVTDLHRLLLQLLKEDNDRRVKRQLS